VASHERLAHAGNGVLLVGTQAEGHSGTAAP
jgi:hypothetical protein